MRETHSYEENGAHNLVLGHYYCIAKWRYKGRRVVVLIQQCDCHGNPGGQCWVAVVLSSDGEDQSLIFLAIQHSSCTGEGGHTQWPQSLRLRALVTVQLTCGHSHNASGLVY